MKIVANIKSMRHSQCHNKNDFYKFDESLPEYLCYLRNKITQMGHDFEISTDYGYSNYNILDARTKEECND